MYTHVNSQVLKTAESLTAVHCVQAALGTQVYIHQISNHKSGHICVYISNHKSGGGWICYTLTKRSPFSLRMVTPVRLSNLLSEYVTFKSCSMLPRLSTVWTRCVGIYAQCWSVEVLKYWSYDSMIYTGRKQIHVNCDWILLGEWKWAHLVILLNSEYAWISIFHHPVHTHTMFDLSSCID